VPSSRLLSAKERASLSVTCVREAQFRTLAQTSRWSLTQLQRQFAHDRLLERLYLMDDGWIVKGAVALLARDLGVRASVDIDVYRAKSTREPRRGAISKKKRSISRDAPRTPELHGSAVAPSRRLAALP
jgi:hypothetical protein